MAFDFSVTGNTKLDTSGFTQGVSSMTVAAGTLIADLVKTASSQLTNLAQSAIRNGSVYETSLAKVGTIADLGKLSIQKLGSQITDMSNTMGIAATDIAEATYQAISAGQDTANAVEFAGQAAKLATAGFTSTTSAVDILTTALNAYGLSADQATHVSDVLLTTQNLGKTSVDELSSSMGKVIPLAAAYNVSVENLSSGLAVMTANGIATAEATTYTKSMLNELGDTGSSVGKILQQQTGKSFAQLSADGKSLGDVLQVLYDSVGDDGTAFAGLWSSVEAGTGALSLVSGGANKFNGVLAQMVDSAGATETAYATMTDTFQHSMDSLQTTAENLSIDLFEAMEPGLTQAAQWGTDCLSTLTEALTEGGPSAMLDAASGILEDLVSGLVQKVPEVADGATQVITSLVQYLSEHQDDIMDAGVQMLESLIIGLTNNLPDLITSAAQLIANFAAALISHTPELLECGAALLTSLVDGIIRSIENLGEAAIACIAKLTGVWDGNMDEWGHIGENIVQGIINGIARLWSRLTSWVSGLIANLVGTASSAAVSGIEKSTSPSSSGTTDSSTTQQNRARRRQAALNGDGISTKSWTERQAEADAAAKAAQQAEKTITSSANKAAAATQKAGGTVQKTVSEVVKSVTSTATTVKDGVTTTTESTTETLKNGTTQQKKVVTETSRQMVKGVLSDVKTITTTAADGSKTVTQSIEAVRDVLETTKDTHTTFADGVETTVEKVTETLADGSQQIKTVTTQTGTELVEGVNRTVKTITTEAADGSKTVEKIIEDAKDVVSTTKDTQTSLINGVETTVEKTTELLKDGSEQVSTVTTQTGKEVIEGVERTVKTVTTKTAEGVETTVRTIEDAGPQYASAGELLTTQLRTKLDSGWDDIKDAIQTDAIGAIGTLADALKNGDLEQLGLWAASYFWNACTDAQREQIAFLAQGALNQLGAKLADTGAQLGQLATSLVAQFVPAAATATTGQTALNVAMDANPILLVISLIGMLVGALISFSGTNTDVANKFKSVWAGVQDFLSVIFEGLLRVVGLGIEGFVILINQLIDVYNSVAGLWDGKISRISNPAWDYADKIAADRKARQADRDKQDDALKANTAAILTANAKLAEMVKQADSLVLSDNMALSRSVAASGTARIAAAASSYTRQGDTVITQNIYSKAQTAADLQREARWEADRAKAQKH